MEKKAAFLGRTEAGKNCFFIIPNPDQGNWVTCVHAVYETRQFADSCAKNDSARHKI